MSYKDNIKSLCSENNCKLKIGGVGLDYKTLYIETSTGYVFSVGGKTYREAFIDLFDNRNKLKK